MKECLYLIIMKTSVDLIKFDLFFKKLLLKKFT